MSEALDQALALTRGRRLVALTGAGCSTESGIPDYRSPGRPQRTPILHRDFLASEAARARYWARSAVGWPRFRRAAPNAGHHALAALERSGALAGLITQNVDGLHQAAGSARVVELHGALGEVRCLGCGDLTGRDEVQALLEALNPGCGVASVEEAPDGDAELALTEGFRVPACPACGGVLKPHVVFFGDNVPCGAAGPGLRALRRGRGAAGGGQLADRVLGLPLRAARGGARGAGADPEPGADARGRAGCVLLVGADRRGAASVGAGAHLRRRGRSLRP